MPRSRARGVARELRALSWRDQHLRRSMSTVILQRLLDVAGGVRGVGLGEFQLGGLSSVSPSQTVRLPRARRPALLHEEPLWVGRFGPSFSPPQESHYRDAVEGSSHV